MADPTSYERNIIQPVTGANALEVPTPSEQKGFVGQNIEAASDFYAPIVYSTLKFYSNFQAEPDSNVDFVPATQAKMNPKPFVVGILPPSVSITGRLLDRSASAGNVVGESEVLDTVEDRGTVVGEREGYPEVTNGSKGAALPDTFWQSYVQMCDRLKVDPYDLAAVLQKESQFNPGARNWGPASEQPRTQPIAQGLCQFIRKTATSPRIGMDEDTWNSFCTLSAEEQLVYVERFYKGKVAGKSKDELNLMTFGYYNNPDGSIYASKEYIEEYQRTHPGAVFPNPERQNKAFMQNTKSSKDGKRITREDLAGRLAKFPTPAIQARIASAQQFLSRNGVPSYSAPAPQDNTTAPDYATTGSANASDARKEMSKTSDRKMEREKLGARFKEAQQAEINDTLRAVEALRNTPPLRMLVNPSSFKINMEKVVSDGNWTRNGPIIEHWGDNQDKIEASGKVAGFFALDAYSPLPDAQGEGPGLTRVSKQYSAAFQNFMSLYMLYRNNANVYTSPYGGTDTLNRLAMLGSMYIYYDDTMYVGSFDNFNITESETAPYTVEYNFTFTVRATFQLDRPPEYSQEASAFIRRRLVLPITSNPVGLEDYSSVDPPPVE